MIDILPSRKGLGVTDPKDMLYAHKGLASDAENLEIDYSESCAGLYADASFHGMIKHSNHEILSYVDDGPVFSRLTGLPSWCPDWSQTPSIPKLPRRSLGWSPDHVAPRLTEDSQTDEVTKRDQFRESHALFKSEEYRVLTCFGIQVGLVTDLSSPLSSESIEHTAQEYFTSILVSLRKVWKTLGVEKSRFEAAHAEESLWESRHDVYHPQKIIVSFTPDIKRHIKSLKNLYADIHKA
jgi:hypothetical protein